ncbi:MAG: hypothetical protein IJ619_11280 [Eubacterium sp.]|nr:hypothetical protein [Eubacterium sp.]
MTAKEEVCLNCGGPVREAFMWNREYSLCDDCLDMIYPLLRRKKTRGIFMLNEHSMEYIPVFDVLRSINKNYMKRIFRFKEENDILAKNFVPTGNLCSGRFEYNTEEETFRVKYIGEVRQREYQEMYSPVIHFEEVTDYYLQEHFHDALGKNGYYPQYDSTDICIETSNPGIPFVEIQLPIVDVEILQSTQSAYRKSADIVEGQLLDLFMKHATDRRKVFPYL